MVEIPAAQRALAILERLAGARAPLTASGLARDLGIPRSSTYQLLTVLEERGFVIHVATERRWAIGLTAFEVGSAYLRSDPIEPIAQPLLRHLALTAPIPVVAHLGIVQGHEVVYLLKERSEHVVTTITDVGVRLPAALTASGRAVLAAMPSNQVRAQLAVEGAFANRTGKGPQTLTALTRLLASERRRGYAEEDGFITKDFASVAAVIAGSSGEPVGAVGLTFRGPSADSRMRERLARAVQRCVVDVVKALHPHRVHSR